MRDIKTDFSAAMDESIAIWEKRSKGIRVSEPCPLCHVNDGKAFIACDGCPIDNLTDNACDETPYHDWDDAVMIHGVDNPRTIVFAKKELRLLRRAKKAMDSGGK